MGRLITEGAFKETTIPTSMPTSHHGTTRTLHHTEKVSQREAINRNGKPLLSLPSALPAF